MDPAACGAKRDVVQLENTDGEVRVHIHVQATPEAQREIGAAETEEVGVHNANQSVAECGDVRVACGEARAIGNSSAGGSTPPGPTTNTGCSSNGQSIRLSYGHSWDGRTRTCGLPRIRRMLCLAELRPIFCGASGETRTRVLWLVARHSNPLNYGC